MEKIRLLRLAALGGWAAFALQAVTQAAVFQGLGDLAGGTASPTPISTGDATYESQGIGVSPDGNTVVGKSIGSGAPDGPGAETPDPGNSTAFKWTSGGGLVDIGHYPTASYYAVANGVTNSGLAVGHGDLLGNYNGQAMQWAAPAGGTPPTLLPMAPPWQRLASYTGDNPVAINAAGKTVIAGMIAEIPYYNSFEAVIWVDGAIKHLGWLGPGPMSPPPTPGPRPDPVNDGYKDYSYAFGINTPGTHIVGYSQSGSIEDTLPPGNPNAPKYTPGQAVIWTDLTGNWTTPPAAVALGQIGGPGVGAGSNPSDITNNGLKVVGSGCTTDSCGGASPTGQSQAFLGTVGNANLTALGVLPVNNLSVVPSSRASAIAGDGTTIVGYSVTDVAILDSGSKPYGVTAHTAFIWDPVLTGGTMMNLKTYLTNSQGLGAALTGWTLKDANSISDDGKVIVGTGINPQGNYEAFRVVLDLTVAPDYGDYNVDGFVDAADYTVWRNNFGAPNETSIHGNGNGTGGVDEGDYTLWKQYYGNDYSGGSGGIFTAAPEPAAGLLFLAGVIGLAFLVARQREDRLCHART